MRKSYLGTIENMPQKIQTIASQYPKGIYNLKLLDDIIDSTDYMLIGYDEWSDSDQITAILAAPFSNFGYVETYNISLTRLIYVKELQPRPDAPKEGEISMCTIAGVECEIGDIIECLGIPFPDHAERYHIVLQDGETRDLGNNNSNMWWQWVPIKNLGHYSQHPNLFDAEDREYYFGNEAPPKEKK